MSALENVLGGVHITIMMCATFRTSPFSYSKTCDTSRPAIGQSAATATGLGGIRFVDFLEQHSRRDRLIPEHCAERRPASIEHGLCHVRLDQSGGVHVAYEDCTIQFDQIRTEFVQCIFTTIRYLCVNCLHS